MPPETPKRAAEKSVSLTPSFTFGLGNLPSFRFTSPRGLNILSSLSPHRFFTKNNKEKETRNVPDNKESTEMDTTYELVRTADSVDIWSLADDSQSLSMNLTSINEESDKDAYFSPNEFLFGLIFSENAEGTPGSVKLKKRKLSAAEDSPCKKLASCIETLVSPKRRFSANSHLDSPNKKVWNARLDEELLRCHTKYSAFKALHGNDPAVFRYTSQNKILSRMLHNKTGVLRSAKQISTRLLKLIKNSVPQINVIPDSVLTPERNHKLTIASSPHVSSDLSAPARLKEVNLFFQYKDAIQGRHVFTAFQADETGHFETNSDFKKFLPSKSEALLRDVEKMSASLAKLKTGICNVSCEVNFNSEYNAASSPLSPMTDPRQFIMANGNFSSSLLVKIPAKNSEQCKSLVLSTTIYKGADKVLHRSKEMVNGFLNRDYLDVEVPFVNKFWSGYLSYLSNGTQDYNDLENLLILQTIHEETSDDPQILLVFSFAPAKTQHGSAKVSLHLLQEENKADEIDELETMLVSSPPIESSPFDASPNKRFQVNTGFRGNQGPNSAPIHNSSLLHSFSACNAQKPPMHQSKSTTFLPTNFNSEIPHMPGNLMRHNSAGHVPTQGQFLQDPALVNAPPMAYFHHPQPPQFAVSNQAPLRQNWVPLPEQHPIVYSAPSSQLGFTTRYSHPEESKPIGKEKSGVKFGPILLYDPSQSIDNMASQQNSESVDAGYQHRFTVPPREIFQPHKIGK